MLRKTIGRSWSKDKDRGETSVVGVEDLTTVEGEGKSGLIIFQEFGGLCIVIRSFFHNILLEIDIIRQASSLVTIR